MVLSKICCQEVVALISMSTWRDSLKSLSGNRTCFGVFNADISKDDRGKLFVIVGVTMHDQLNSYFSYVEESLIVVHEFNVNYSLLKA